MMKRTENTEAAQCDRVDVDRFEEAVDESVEERKGHASRPSPRTPWLVKRRPL
jgi:hypothetical protein